MTRIYLVALIGTVVLLAGCGSGTLNEPLDGQNIPVIILMYVPPQATAEFDLFTSRVHVPRPVPATGRVGNVRSVINGHVLAVKDGRVRVKFSLDRMEADCERRVLTLQMTDIVTKETYDVRVRRDPYYMSTQGRTGGGPNLDTPDCLIWDVGGPGVTLRFEVLGFFDLSPLCGTA